MGSNVVDVRDLLGPSDMGKATFWVGVHDDTKTESELGRWIV